MSFITFHRKTLALLFSLFSLTAPEILAEMHWSHKDHHQPDYANMLYGCVWKHVTFDKSGDSKDVTHVTKESLKFIQKRYPTFDAQEFSLRYATQIDLWYSDTDHSPLAFTKHVKDHRGHEFPVSVPVSFGVTYNLHFVSVTNESTTLHFLTVTTTHQEELYVYSHTYYNVLSPDYLKSLETCSSSICSSREQPKSLHILSNASRNKGLWLPHCCSPHHCNESSHICQPPSNAVHSDKVTQQEHSAEKYFSIMSYNIWNFNTYHKESVEYPSRMFALARLLKLANPDIICFQEVRFESPLGENLGPSQMNFLVSQLHKYQFVYQPAQMQSNSLEQGRTEEGLAIFSKFPILHHDYLLLFRNRSNSADQNQRVCLHVVVEVPILGKVHIFNTHLSLSHEAREESVKQILEFMSMTGDEPAVLMGDLNATPEEKAIRMLTENTLLLDTWDYLQPDDSGFTFSCLEAELSKRIDYIFMKRSDKMAPQNIEVVQDKTKSEAASDHRAVKASFKIKIKK